MTEQLIKIDLRTSMRTLWLSIFLIIFLHSKFVVAGLIRDSEIEETIELIISPLKKTTNIRDLKIHIIDDLNPNAFTAGGNDIFIHSGLIIKFPDPDVLRGVIAHEMGHITGRHVARQHEIIENYKKYAIGATALGIATAISGAAAPGLAVLIGGSEFSEKSLLAYSRSFESSADHSAMNLLEQSGHSTIGMIKFFEEMRIHKGRGVVNPYDQTHPLDRQRLNVIRKFNQQSKYKNSQNSKNIIYRYNRAVAKLAAFTMDLPDAKHYLQDKDNQELNYYMQAINNFRTGNFKAAIKSIDKLITLKSGDPYYHELKGEILFEAGYGIRALDEYNLILKSRKKDVLMRLGRAIVGVTGYKDKPKKMKKKPFLDDLLYVTKKEPDNLLALFYLAIYYEHVGLKGKSYLNSALIALKTGNESNALRMAKAALEILPKEFPDWYKASDIVAAME